MENRVAYKIKSVSNTVVIIKFLEISIACLKRWNYSLHDVPS